MLSGQQAEYEVRAAEVLANWVGSSHQAQLAIEDLTDEGILLIPVDALTRPYGQGVMVVLSAPAAAFLKAFMAHCNDAKILPPEDDKALTTSAWMEEIGAALTSALASQEGGPGG